MKITSYKCRLDIQSAFGQKLHWDGTVAGRTCSVGTQKSGRNDRRFSLQMAFYQEKIISLLELKLELSNADIPILVRRIY
jgi:hypothetical protein